MGKSRKFRKPKEEVQPPPTIGYDGHPPIFRQARDLSGEGKREKINGPQNINIDRLEWMLDRKLIESHHHTAGRKLQGAWETAQISASLSLAGGGRGGCANTSLSDAKCDALDMLNRARCALSPMNWRLIDLVVIEGMSAEKAASKMKFNCRSGMPTLLMALDSLAKHFGLCTIAR